MGTTKTDASKLGFSRLGVLKPSAAKVHSQYVRMADGTQIAIDVWLPAEQKLSGGSHQPQGPFPIIVRQTRYFRSVQLRRPLRWLTGGHPFDHTGLYAKRRRRFMENGFGWVDVDARGSGASSNYRTAPWSQPEVADAMEIVHWISNQPWCNGQIGSLGISYDGTAAEWLLCHPESSADEFPVFAIAPRFSSCDAFADIGFPGGLKNVGFSNRWHRTNEALDRNRLCDLVGWPVTLITGGVTPVDGDRSGQQRDQAVADHAENYDVLQRMSQIGFTDDEAVDEREVVQPRWSPEGTPLRGSQLISPLYYSQQINASKIPIFSYSGWWDGGYAKVAALRFLRSPNPGSRLILGPWNHGGGWNVDARGSGISSVKEKFDHDHALVEFFDQCRSHSKGSTAAEAGENMLPVSYYTMGDHQLPRWNQAASWPPPKVTDRTFFLTEDQSLQREVDNNGPPNRQPFQISYQATAATTGKTNRWQTQAQPDAPVRYPDRSKDAHLRLNFRSAPLSESITVTGHPVVNLSVASDADNGSLFVYLEEVTSSGAIRMVTEGLLSLRHRNEGTSLVGKTSAIETACLRCGIPFRTYCRKDALPMPVVSGDKPHPDDFQDVVLDLLPVSYRFGAGNCYQISIALVDQGNFEVTTTQPETANSGTSVKAMVANKIWLRQTSRRSLWLRLPIEADEVETAVNAD